MEGQAWDYGGSSLGQWRVKPGTRKGTALRLRVYESKAKYLKRGNKNIGLIGLMREKEGKNYVRSQLGRFLDRLDRKKGTRITLNNQMEFEP